MEVWSGTDVWGVGLRDDEGELEKCRASWAERWDAMVATGVEGPAYDDDSEGEGRVRDEGRISAGCVCNELNLRVKQGPGAVTVTVAQMLSAVEEGEGRCDREGGGGVVLFLTVLQGPASKRCASV